jgi:hypothetical protein
MASSVKSPQSITPHVSTAQSLADQAMSEINPAKRAKIIEGILAALESEQSEQASLDSAA